MSILSGIGAIICLVAAVKHEVPAAIQRLIRFVGSLLTLSFLRGQRRSRSSIRTETAFLTSRSAQARLDPRRATSSPQIALHHADPYVRSPWIRTLGEGRLHATGLCSEGLGVILDDDECPSHRRASSEMKLITREARTG